MQLKRGNWKFKKTTKSIIFKNDKSDWYEIDCERDSYFDWLMHLCETKSWMTKTDLLDLTNLFFDLQKEYCDLPIFNTVPQSHNLMPICAAIINTEKN